MHRPTSFFGKLLLDDGFDRAVVAAGAAANAGVGVDDVHLVALGDGLNRAVVGASAALDAGVSNLVCHDYVPPCLFFIPDTVMVMFILAWISEKAIPNFTFLRIFFAGRGENSRQREGTVWVIERMRRI
jgi:hypothetical protein